VKRALGAWAAACTLACGAPGPGASPSPVAVARSALLTPDPSALGLSFAARLNARRVSEAVQRYAPDAVLMAPNGDILSGRESIEKYWNDLVAHGFDGLRLQPLRASASDAVAYETGTYELRLTEGASPTASTGHFVTVFKRSDDGTWRVVYDVLNELPQAITAPASTSASSPGPLPRP
jgi:ketosteroid isomerase-like protein